MHFVLSDNFTRQLKSLQTSYEERASIDLSTAQQPYAISCFFGAKDVATRKKQLQFIENWVTLLENELTLEVTSPETAQTHLAALKIMVSVCLYIKDQIQNDYKIRSGTSTILSKLIDEAMGKRSKNRLDSESRACCLLATQRFLSEKGQFEAINARLVKPFNEKQWRDFHTFVDKECELIDVKYKEHYPVTRVMMPLIAKPLEIAGYTTGFIVGQMVSKSTKLLRARYALTAAIGSGLMVVMGPTASVGVMLLAPTYAGKILDTFCGVSFAWLFGIAANIAGQSIGLGVGFSLDMSWKLLQKTCSLLASFYSAHPDKLSGISLITGNKILEGVELKWVDLQDLESHPLSTEETTYQACPIEFDFNENEILVKINGEKATFPWQEDNKPYMEELRKLFAAEAQGATKLIEDFVEAEESSGDMSVSMTQS